MNFDDSLFEDFSSNKKEKKKQYPYSVRRQEFRWFLSDDNSSDNTRVIEKLKYKADYLYAQSKYTEAIKCYEQLSPLIPASNTVLTQEVCESRVMCLTRLDETEEAEKCLKEMVKEAKMSTNMWHLMFTIERDKKNLEEAVFAVQQCLKDNEEVALYWIDLAETYALLSTCFDWSNDFNTCQYREQNIELENLDQSLFCESNKNPVGVTAKGSISSTCRQSQTPSSSISCNVEGREILENELLIRNKHTENETKEGSRNTVKTVEMSCTVEELDKELLWNEHAETERNKDLLNTAENVVTNKIALTSKESLSCTVEGNKLLDRRLLQSNKHAETDTKEDVLNTRMSNCSIEESGTTHSEENSSVKSNKLKSYAENHPYCYCALCSLVISKFLLHKYSTHSQFAKCERRCENILKVNFLIKKITCATNEIVNETRKRPKTETAQFLKSMKITCPHLESNMYI